MVIELTGVPADVRRYRTSAVRGNGLNPIWNETFTFEVRCAMWVIIKPSQEDLGDAYRRLVTDFPMANCTHCAGGVPRAGSIAPECLGQRARPRPRRLRRQPSGGGVLHAVGGWGVRI